MVKSILFINLSSTSGGAEHVLASIIKEFEKSSKTEVYLLSCPGIVFESLINKKRVFSVKVNPTGFSGNILQVLKVIAYFIVVNIKVFHLLLKYRIKIVYANNMNSMFYSYLSCKILNRPIIFHYHGLGANQFNRPIYQKLIIFLIDKANRTICPSKSTVVPFSLSKEALDKVLVIHNGIDHDLFVFSDEKKIELRELVRSEYSIKNDDILIIQVGNISEGKGQHHLVNALGKLPEMIKVIFVGEVDEEKKIALISSLDQSSSSKLIFTGYQEDVRPFLCAADLMVHLSSAETFGLAVLQGLAYKIPVIVNDLASFREWLSDEEVLFINKDLGGSALKAISSFLKNRDEFNKRCKKGYSLAMKYSLSNMINRIKKSVNIVK